MSKRERHPENAVWRLSQEEEEEELRPQVRGASPRVLTATKDDNDKSLLGTWPLKEDDDELAALLHQLH